MGPRGWDGVLRGSGRGGDGFERRSGKVGRRGIRGSRVRTRRGGNLSRRERDSRAVPGAVHAGHERREIVRGENERAGGCD